jgi:hypothetical protein
MGADVMLMNEPNSKWIRLATGLTLALVVPLAGSIDVGEPDIRVERDVFGATYMMDLAVGDFSKTWQMAVNAGLPVSGILCIAGLPATDEISNVEIESIARPVELPVGPAASSVVSRDSQAGGLRYLMLYVHADIRLCETKDAGLGTLVIGDAGVIDAAPGWDIWLTQ